MPGSTYYRVGGLQAKISDFRLDKYEITVGRFRKFIASYSQDMIPAGAGKNPNNSKDPGWDAAWDKNLPVDAAALTSAMKCPNSTLVGVETSETHPMNCLDWYTAFAFCAWDGGRLPTETEWAYAASAGGEQRVYPWSVPPESTTIDCSYATYAHCRGLSIPYYVGAASPKGDGKYGQADLSGNVAEWTLDSYTSQLVVPCVDCAVTDALAERVMRGGAFDGLEVTVTSSIRIPVDPPARSWHIGARCARRP